MSARVRPRSVSRWRRTPRISSATVHERVHAAGRELEVGHRVRQRVDVVGRAGAVQPAQVQDAGEESGTSCSGPSHTRRTTTGRPAGTASRDAAIAGRADSSPTIRCQSASGSGR